MAGRPSTYTPEAKAAVLVVIRANDGNIKRTARETGVPITTVRTWKEEMAREGYSPAVAGALSEATEKFLGRAEEVRSKALKLIETKIEAGDAKVGELNAVVGTLTDKMRLITGEATSRTESVQVGPSPEEFGRRLIDYVEQAALAQEERTTEIIDAEYAEQAEVLALPSGPNKEI